MRWLHPVRRYPYSAGVMSGLLLGLLVAALTMTLKAHYALIPCMTQWNRRAFDDGRTCSHVDLSACGMARGYASSPLVLYYARYGRLF